MSFYKNYVRLCNEIGLSPSAAAENVGIKKSNVTHWRDGGGVRDSTVEKLCNTYGWTREQLTHDCRHTFRSKLDSAGANSVAIDRIMGHSSKTIGEKVYTHKTVEELHQAIKLLSYGPVSS